MICLSCKSSGLISFLMEKFGTVARYFCKFSGCLALCVKSQIKSAAVLMSEISAFRRYGAVIEVQIPILLLCS